MVCVLCTVACFPITLTFLFLLPTLLSQYESIGCDLLDFTERERTSNNVGEGIRATDVHRVHDNRRGNHRCWTTVGRGKFYNRRSRYYLE